MKKERGIPMKDLTHDQRRLILFDDQVMRPKEVREKWNITDNTLNHIRFFHGKSSARARGYYYKDLLQGAVHPLVERIRELKARDYTSEDVAHELGLPLDIINNNW